MAKRRGQCCHKHIVGNTTFFCMEPTGHQCPHSFSVTMDDLMREYERAELAKAEIERLRERIAELDFQSRAESSPLSMDGCIGCAIHPITEEWVRRYPALAVSDLNFLRQEISARSDLQQAYLDCWRNDKARAERAEAELARQNAANDMIAKERDAWERLAKSAEQAAKRYRWLRRLDHFAQVDAMLDTTEYNSLDAAVDAAMWLEAGDGLDLTCPEL